MIQMIECCLYRVLYHIDELMNDWRSLIRIYFGYFFNLKKLKKKLLKKIILKNFKKAQFYNLILYIFSHKKLNFRFSNRCNLLESSGSPPLTNKPIFK